MKKNINIILPILLALTLPGISSYSLDKALYIQGTSPIGNWIIGFFILYGLWYLLWFTFHRKSKNKIWIGVLGLTIYYSVLIVVLYFLQERTIVDIRWHAVIRFTLLAILFLSVQYALRAQDNIARLELEKEQIQTDNYRVQLKALRAKIDPHFLFNSLNTLRSMVRQQHTNSEEFIMSLSQFYRQTLKYNEDTMILLSEELAVLQSYLFVMKSRNEKAVAINLDVDDSLHRFHLPTLALQIVVENCFKHNSMTSKNPLQIDIYSTDDFAIVVSNNIQAKIGEEESSGYGLNMLRKRYELMEVRDGIVIEQSPTQFTVKLKLI